MAKKNQISAIEGEKVILVLNTRQGPGKFEGEGAIGEYMYEQSMAGACDDDIQDEGFGIYDLILLEKPVVVVEDRKLVKGEPAYWTAGGAILFHRESGFVDVTYYDTKKEAQDAWNKLMSDYEAYIEEFEDEEY